MICPDCEFEVERLNKFGICEDCAKRKSNKKYRKLEYVKLKDIKGTKEYVSAIGHRKNKKNNSENNNVDNEIQQINLVDVDYKKMAKEVVEKDIEDRISKLKLDKNTLNLPLGFVLESFVRIFNKNIVEEKICLKMNMKCL